MISSTALTQRYNYLDYIISSIHNEQINFGLQKTVRYHQVILRNYFVITSTVSAMCSCVNI